MIRFYLLLFALLVPSSFLHSQSLWRPCSVPTQSDINVVIVAPGGSVLVATLAGLYRSTDGGATWSEITAELVGPDVVTLWAGADGVLWAGTHARSPLVGYTWRSIDDGVTWEKVPGPSNIETFAEGNGVIHAAGVGGAWRSSDNGATWSGPTLDSLRVSAVTTAANGDVIAGTVIGPYDRIYRSSDNGATWTPSDEGMRYANINVLARDPNGDLWAGTYSHLPADSNVYRSTDNGRTWRPQALEDTWVTSFVFNANGDMFAGARGPGFEGEASPNGVWRSRDHGASWSDISNGLASHAVLSLAVDEEGFIYAATTSGLFKSLQSTLGVHTSDPVTAGTTLEVIGANPFHASTTIRYTLRSRAPARLAIIDARGELVEHLPVEQTVGSHVIEWNGTGHASGLYYCRLQSGAGVVTQPIVIVR